MNNNSIIKICIMSLPLGLLQFFRQYLAKWITYDGVMLLQFLVICFIIWLMFKNKL
ncbi:hypothetical protein [Candidatus Trichorickettsia mobilis]|uniref:hypothetical protein n=1 Tax=Candidatus Trichorickettsia mobilis TaxID=1346319 RepID=UPI0029301A9F|nr:hypothetical protein [Candidatus Trichorickettsia mobilis]